MMLLILIFVSFILLVHLVLCVRYVYSLEAGAKALRVVYDDVLFTIFEFFTGAVCGNLVRIIVSSILYIFVIAEESGRLRLTNLFTRVLHPRHTSCSFTSSYSPLHIYSSISSHCPPSPSVFRSLSFSLSLFLSPFVY